MTDAGGAAAQIEQAERSLRSARILLDDGDVNGAMNRLYYAVFHGACAALASRGIEIPRTHAGTIGKFGQAFVKPGIVDLELGRTFKEAEQVRYAADYRGDVLGVDVVEPMMRAGAAFVSRMKELTEAG